MNNGTLNCGTHTAVLYFLLRETLLKKGSPSNSLPKTFSVKFCPYRALQVNYEFFTSRKSALYGQN